MKNIRVFILKTFKKLKLSFIFIVPFLCFFAVSPICIMSSYSQIQETSNTITNETLKTGNKLVSYTKTESSKESINFLTQYYSFKDRFHSYSFCLETYDPTKIKKFKISSIGQNFDLDKNTYTLIENNEFNDISFLCSPGFQIENLNSQNNSQNPTFKNSVYDFEYKYKGLAKGDDTHVTHYAQYCAIHQEQANELIAQFNNKNHGQITENELIGMYIKVYSENFDESFTFRIFNILKENDEILNDYNNALGNFIVVNDYYFHQKKLILSYMFSTNAYQNYFNLKSTIDFYAKNNYKPLYGNKTTTTSSEKEIQTSLQNIMQNYSTNNAKMLGILLVVFAILIIYLIFIIRKFAKTKTIIVFGMLIPILSYLIIKLITFFTGMIIWYSYATALTYLLFTLVYEIYMIYLLFKVHYENKF